MRATAGGSPRDWGSRSQVHDGSVIVSSVGVSPAYFQTTGSVVSASSCSSYQAARPLYQPSATDLKVFSEAFVGHLQVVTTCFSQTDRDLLGAAGITQNFVVELIGSAQMVAGKLATTASDALDKLPTLLWAARGHGNAELHECTVELHGSIATMRKEAQSVRADYIDLLKYAQYLGQCTQLTVDQLVMSSLPEPVEDESGSLECQSQFGLELTDAQKDSQRYLELTLVHLDSMCQVLEDCSDFWLMLHEAELQLRKLEKESKLLSEGPRPESEHRRSEP